MLALYFLRMLPVLLFLELCSALILVKTLTARSYLEGVLLLFFIFGNFGIEKETCGA
jgi:hypothetical protein